MKDNTGFEYIFNSGMKVFSQLFVAHRKTEAGEIPCAYATPFEDNAAGKKRQATAIGWAGEGAIQKLVDNVPRTGFKVTDEIKRVYYGGGNVVWRIQDPDGWEIEIESANLQAIIMVAGLQAGGEINGKCLWGRADGKNILLHETSDEFKNAIQAAETLKKPKEVSTTGRTIGMKYLTMSGDTVIYLGKMWVHSIKKGETANCRDPLEVLEAAKYDVVMKANYNNSYDILLYKKAPLVREEGKSQWTEKDLPTLIGNFTYGGHAYENKKAYPVTFAGNTENVPMLCQLEKTDAKWSWRTYKGSRIDINWMLDDYTDHKWEDGKMLTFKKVKARHDLFKMQISRYGKYFDSCVWMSDDGKMWAGADYGYQEYLPEVFVKDGLLYTAAQSDHWSGSDKIHEGNLSFPLFNTKQEGVDYFKKAIANGQVVEFFVEAC